MEPQGETIKDLETLCSAFINYDVSTIEQLRRYKKDILHSILK